MDEQEDTGSDYTWTESAPQVTPAATIAMKTDASSAVASGTAEAAIPVSDSASTDKPAKKRKGFWYYLRPHRAYSKTIMNIVVILLTIPALYIMLEVMSYTSFSWDLFSFTNEAGNLATSKLADATLYYNIFRPVCYINIAIIALFFLAMFALTNRLRLSLMATTIAIFVIGLANHYVMLFRGTPFVFSDITSAGTAFAVTNLSEFSLFYTDPTTNQLAITPNVVNVLFGAGILIVLLFLQYRTDFRFKTLPANIIVRVLIVAFLIYSPAVVKDVDLTHQLSATYRKFWKPEWDVRMNGYAYFLMYAALTYTDEAPEGYSVEKVEQIYADWLATQGDTSDQSSNATSSSVDSAATSTGSSSSIAASVGSTENSVSTGSTTSTTSTASTATNTTESVSTSQTSATSQSASGSASAVVASQASSSSGSSATSDQTISTISDAANEAAANGENPNIIFILSESLYDYTIAPSWSYGDYLSYIHSLANADNAYFGYMTVSCTGGGTAQTEWSILTGNSPQFISASCPFPSAVKAGSQSIVSTLNADGYNCIATHPANPGNYARNTVYAELGFSDFITEDTYNDSEDIGYYVSDEAFYNHITQLYEQNTADGSNLFMHCLSMQNHSPYNVAGVFGNYISFQNGISNAFNIYLNGAYLTDKDTEILVDYFKQCDKPTIVVIYGDHSPYVQINSTDVTQYVYNDSATGLDMIEEYYDTPVIVFANYDVDLSALKTSLDTSTRNYLGSNNYLGATILDIAGVDTSDWEKYLLDLKAKYPIISKAGIVDADGNYTVSDKADDIQNIFEYHLLEYNNIFGEKDILNDMFYLKDANNAS